MNKIKTILFDVDGVLIDSEKVYQACWQKAAQQQGYVLPAQRALQLRSLDSRLASQLFLEWYANPNAYPAIRAARKEIMQQYLADHPLALKPGVKDVLAYLKEQQYCLAIVTASDLQKATDYLHRVGIDTYFSRIICSKMVTRGKPYPDVYEYAASQLQLPPQQCMAVEDSPNGVQSAHTAGCRTIMIPDLSPYTDDLKPYVDAHYATMSEFLQREIKETNVCKN